ncbi:MAG TPA: 30S ribosomal protein S6 [Archangium sp.]|jgi:small subunit ribosomal protein S6|uniref:Small ribosomal subunit protein bS6 n=1 Tax=Archangium gephyra TaxID=48 RepID=A0AAC8Q771_9BACT|nr:MULTISPECIES: 30S ribosomal protein S6 [Archangium]AKJ02144.1 SSU ribosomal protein S6p [Archangium gephyra]REG28924.1 small subunit ribosomal protein S6 [Archangium gephyra]HEX5746895.1 30S ribosomal protein S6 [Archangium sp.]
MAETQAAKRLREYETIFLVKPDLTDDNVDKLKERVRGIVGREGGKVLRFTVWGKKKTAFPIAKQPRAIYVHASYLGGTGLVAELERNLRNYDEVTRFLSTKLADEVDPESRPVLEDLKLAGDVEETRPGAPAGVERAAVVDDVAETEEEGTEEA